MLSEICAGITLCRDGKLLFAARAVRMFSFGGITVVLLLFLSEIGFSDAIIGACLTSILAGDLCITLVLTTYADRFGRRRTLVIGGLLKVFAGLVFALSRNVYITVLAGTLGVITPTGGDIGPFLSIETAALTDLLQGGQVATVFGWYQLVGGVTQAFGALAAGWGVSALVSSGMSTLFAFRCVVLGYAVAGCLLTVIYLMLSEAAEARPSATYTHRTILSSFIGLHSNRSRSVVARLSALFALDAFAGGFSMQTFISLWFERRWALDPRHLGSMLMGVNLIAALSGLVVGPLVSRYGAVQVMVMTHLPSNFINICVPLMSSRESAVLMLLLRFSISQMDVPARQAFVVQCVSSDERSAANGLTSIARSVGLLISPLILAYMTAAAPGSTLFNMPWFICGLLKVVYDLTLYASFQAGWYSAPPQPEKEGKGERGVREPGGKEGEGESAREEAGQELKEVQVEEEEEAEEEVPARLGLSALHSEQPNQAFLRSHSKSEREVVRGGARRELVAPGRGGGGQGVVCANAEMGGVDCGGDEMGLFTDFFDDALFAPFEVEEEDTQQGSQVLREERTREEKGCRQAY